VDLIAGGPGLKPSLKGVANIHGRLNLPDMPSATSPWRHGLWVAGLVALFWLACFCFPAVWAATGIGEGDRPFLDLHGLLAAADARQAGVNPYLPNNFDPYHRPHVYSSWWLELRRLGLGRSDTIWLGSVLVAAVLLMAVFMVRPVTRREGVALLLLLASPALLLAINRANNDLVVFIIISLGLLCFRRETWVWRALGVGLLAVSAVLKYSPLTTLVVLLDFRSRRSFLGGLALYGLVLALAWPSLGEGFHSALKYNPAPYWIYAYGAPVLLRDLEIQASSAWLWPAILLVAWAAMQARPALTRQEPAGPARTAEREFMCGAALLVGLFFLGSTFVYKLLFAVWLLPWLLRPGAGGSEPGWCRATWNLLLLVVWLEGTVAVEINLLAGPLSEATAHGLLKTTLVITQLATWALVACLLRFVLGYAARRARTLWVGA